ncbi:MAG: group I truncated hemoglobin [Bradymonadia bacterium]
MSQSLYEKYGGFATISAVVHDFYDKILASDTLKPWFEGVEMSRLIDHQTKFLCSVLGGPEQYTGRQLAAAHRRLSITPEAFDEVAELLVEALEDAGVEDADIQTIAGVVTGAKGDVVS